MTKERSNRFSTLFVSLLSTFVVVVIGGFTLLSTNVPNASAQVQGSLDSGVGAAKSKTLEKGLKENTDRFTGAISAKETTGKENQEAHNWQTFKNIQTAIICSTVPSCTDSEGNSLTQDITTSMSGMVGYMFTNQPATTYVAVADFFNSAGIPVAQPAYAQSAVGGLGFAALSPVLNAWKTFRNIAFLFFVIIILVVGFMIMFRQKVGQAAVTAQQAIPRVVVALITVSFSYAIAGLLIDAMYIIMTLMVFVFGLGEYQSVFLGDNALTLGWKLVTSGAYESFNAIKGLIDAVSPINLGEDYLGGLTVGVVVSIAIVFAMFRLFFELLKTYVTIIISITISPLLLMMGAIPGRDVFWGWLRGLIGNLAAFPIVLLLLILYDQLTGGLSGGGGGGRASQASRTNSDTDSGFVSVADHFNNAGNFVEQAQAQEQAVLNGGFAPPYLFGAIQPGGIAEFFIGMGILLIMTDLVKQGKKALGADEGVFGQFATAFGDSLKKGWSGDQELIPGVAATNLSRYGISGKNIVSRFGFGNEKSREIAEKGKGRRIDSLLGRRGMLGEIGYQYQRREKIRSIDSTEQPTRSIPRENRVPRNNDTATRQSQRRPGSQQID